MEWERVLQEEDPEVRPGDGHHRRRLRAGGAKEVDEGGGEALDGVDLGVDGGEGGEGAELGGKVGRGGAGGEVVEVGGGEDDGGVGVAVPVLQRPPLRRHLRRWTDGEGDGGGGED